jgi:hypothetical protein
VRHITAAAITLAGLLAAPAARADVTYDFVYTSAVGPVGAVPVAEMPLNSITFTDAAVASGHARFGDPNSISGEPCTPATLQSCIAASGFVAGTVGLDPAPASLESGHSLFSVTFDPDGTLAGAIDLTDSGDFNGLQISGSEQAWSGAIGSEDDNVCTGQPRGGHGGGCRISGYWIDPAAGGSASLPSPSSLALLLPALGMLALLRRRPVRTVPR